MGFSAWARTVAGALLAWTLFAGAATAPVAAQTPRPFENWRAAIVSADWRDGQGWPIAAFDNARRDLATGFVAAGFSRSRIVDYSLRPDRANPVTPTQALEGIAAAMAGPKTGCLIYVTSHGSPEGVVFGNQTISPARMSDLVRGWCGEQPTVVVVSACFSGVFVDALAAPNRMILTAASSTRSSFGCSAGATYPYFDGCVLEALPTASDFLALAAAARDCVQRREQVEKLSPSSDPQLSVGASLRRVLPTLRFNRAQS